MSVLRVIAAVPETLAVLALPPLLLSIIVKTKAWFAGRVGPPWLQPYFDLAQLLRKQPVYSRTTTWVFRAGPIVNLAALLTAAMLIPVLTRDTLLGFAGDVILIAYLLALGRMFTVLAAMDTGSSFEGMGAAREVTFGTMSEPALFLSFVVLAIGSRSLQLGQMLGPLPYGAWGPVGSALVLVVGALLIVLITETCRVPVDDPATHLELTMIHEVMALDHSGPDFALITYAAALKFMLLGSILLHAALPHAALPGWADAPLRLAELAALAALIGVLESSMARLRLNRVPLLLAGATVLALLAAVLTLTPGCFMTWQTTIDMVLVLVILLDLAILIVSRLVTGVRFFAVQSLLLAFLPLLGLAAHGEALSLHAPLVAVGTIALKVVLIPYILIRIVRTGEIHAEITPLLGFTASVFVGAFLVAASFAVAARLPLPLAPLSSMIVPASFSTLMIGLLVLISRLKAITQVLGFLLVENGIFLFGLMLLKSMPVLVELGILLDVFVGVFIMAIVVYHIRREFDHMDTDALSEAESR